MTEVRESIGAWRPKKSRGHIEFIGRWEYWRVDDELYRSPIDAPVEDGVRRNEQWVGEYSQSAMSLIRRLFERGGV